MKTIRWGAIGCGDVMEVKSGPGFQLAENSALVAVMRRNGRLAEDYARRHGVPRWHDDADAIIEAKDIDAVYIATLPDTHCDFVQRCAAAGKPVYVEKPMAANYAECVAMIDACFRHSVPLFVAYYRRALPYLIKVRDLISAGKIGALRVVAVRHYAKNDNGINKNGKLPWRVDPVFSVGGLFFETACHTIDTLDFLFGPMTIAGNSAINIARDYPVVDTVTASFLFANGIPGSDVWSFATDRDFETIEVIGSKGTISFHLYSFASISVVQDGLVKEIDVSNPPHVQQPLIQSIVNELNGIGSCPSTGESAARTALITDAILGSKQTKTVVPSSTRNGL